ncbi:hypothetical protein KQI52_12050 [bacterium]|nr:hypothetical protein [bacterium]
MVSVLKRVFAAAFAGLFCSTLAAQPLELLWFRDDYPRGYGSYTDVPTDVVYNGDRLVVAGYGFDPGDYLFRATISSYTPAGDRLTFYPLDVGYTGSWSRSVKAMARFSCTRMSFQWLVIA